MSEDRFQFDPFLRALLRASHEEDTVESLENLINTAIDAAYHAGYHDGQKVRP